MKRLGLILALVVGLAGAGCRHNLIPENPAAADALKADAVVIRVNELQAAVIQACGPAPTCQPNSLDTNLARTIVATSIDLRTVLKATPDGWRAMVKQTWAQAKPKFAAVTNPAILAAIALVDVGIGGL